MMAEQSVSVDLEAVRRALDVDARLAAIPASHAVRGFLFKMNEDALARAGRSAVAAFKHIAKPKNRWVFRTYSVAEYIEETAVVAAILDSSNPSRAIRRIWRETPRYAPILNAERFVALLGVDVLDAMKWLEQQRPTFCNYGSWRLEPRAPGYFVMHYFDEWTWIDSAHRGGMEGLLDACRATGDLELSLDSPYDGHLHVRWRKR